MPGPHGEGHIDSGLGDEDFAARPALGSSTREQGPVDTMLGYVVGLFWGKVV